MITVEIRIVDLSQNTWMLSAILLVGKLGLWMEELKKKKEKLWKNSIKDFISTISSKIYLSALKTDRLK